MSLVANDGGFIIQQAIDRGTSVSRWPGHLRPLDVFVRSVNNGPATIKQYMIVAQGTQVLEKNQL